MVGIQTIRYKTQSNQNLDDEDDKRKFYDICGFIHDNLVYQKRPSTFSLKIQMAGPKNCDAAILKRYKWLG